MNGRDYMGLVKQLPCVLCTILGDTQNSPTAAHHVRAGRGIAQRSGDFCVVALCYECHQGPLGVHGDRTLLRIAKVEEMDLLDATIESAVTLLLKEGPACATFF